MNRQQKSDVIMELKESFSGSPASFVVGVQKLTVTQLQALRSKLRQNGGTLKIAKARLMRRAASGLEGAGVLDPYFKEQIGVVFTAGQTPAIAKVLYDFSKDHQAFTIVAGYMEAEFLDKNAIVRVASLPPREVLLAQVCGTLKAPMNNMATVLNLLMLRLLWTLKQVGDKKS
jgi:large subunit ribosomal protein L10